MDTKTKVLDRINREVKRELKKELQKHLKESVTFEIGETDDKEAPMSIEEKKRFIQSVYRFAEYANSVRREHNLLEVCKRMNEMIGAAQKLTLAETQDSFDAVTVKRHMKELNDRYNLFEKTAKEMHTLQQRLESAYDDIGQVLNKYYEINDLVNETTDKRTGNKTSFREFQQKAMKKFK